MLNPSSGDDLGRAVLKRNDLVEQELAKNAEALKGCRIEPVQNWIDLQASFVLTSSYEGRNSRPNLLRSVYLDFCLTSAGRGRDFPAPPGTERNADGTCLADNSEQ